MKLKTVPARLGVQWMRAGVRVFFQQPFGFCAVFSVIGLAVLLLVQVPVIGPVLSVMLMPLATVVFMLASRDALIGHRLRPALLLAPVREPALRRRLLVLGAVYAACLIVVALAAHLIDGGLVDALVTTVANGDTPDEATLQDPRLELGVLLRLAAMAVVSLVFWHAPALVAWGGMSTSKALFASTVACWRARGAFTLYMVAWLGAMVGLTLVVQAVLALLGMADAATQAVLPLVMLLSTAYYASIYFSFVDSFDVEPATPGSGALPPPAVNP